MERHTEDKQYTLGFDEDPSQLEFDFGEEYKSKKKEEHYMNLDEFFGFCLEYKFGYKVFDNDAKGNVNYKFKTVDVNPVFDEDGLTVASMFVNHYSDNVIAFPLVDTAVDIVAQQFYNQHRETVDTVADHLLNKRFKNIEDLIDEIGD